jgi:hypothetical protein
MIGKHVLLCSADRIAEVAAPLSAHLTLDIIQGTVDLIPDNWLRDARALLV